MMTAFVIGILLAVAWFVLKAVIANQQRKQNQAEGVIAAWEGLRITNTELIEGYGQNARRHPLNGLTARVEDSGTHSHNDKRRVHLTVEGPNTAIVRTKQIGGRSDGPTSYHADENARKFAAALNLASRQVG
jgi:hypothetical protein